MFLGTEWSTGVSRVRLPYPRTTLRSYTLIVPRADDWPLPSDAPSCGFPYAFHGLGLERRNPHLHVSLVEVTSYPTLLSLHSGWQSQIGRGADRHTDDDSLSFPVDRTGRYGRWDNDWVITVLTTLPGPVVETDLTSRKVTVIRPRFTTSCKSPDRLLQENENGRSGQV